MKELPRKAMHLTLAFLWVIIKAIEIFLDFFRELFVRISRKFYPDEYKDIDVNLNFFQKVTVPYFIPKEIWIHPGKKKKKKNRAISPSQSGLTQFPY